MVSASLAGLSSKGVLMASISLKNIRKSFNAVPAVRDLSLEIADGEFIALLGPSGCGKTTTLRMISGLENPDSGTILIDGQDVTNLPPRNRDVAMVFQDYALYPHMTILENIGYPLKVRGIAKKDIEKSVQEVADNLQIGGLLHRRPGQLSGGQQQRAAVARAVVHQARVFLFDEPLSNLDAKLRLEARAFLKHLQNNVNITAVYVTHDQAEAMALADRIVVMNQGRIMQVGSPIEIYRKPANIFVAAFIGNPPMNLLPCSISDNQVCILTKDSELSFPIDSEKLPKQLRAGEKMTLGIRPEHISIHTAEQEKSIPAELYVTQALGGESLIIVKLGEQLLSIRRFEDEVPDFPKQLWLSFEAERLFFYNNEGDLLG
jgi:multiple sugar transport system ATP-binding protein